jgi:hypothetical protein
MGDRKPILCVDFDGVIHSYTSGWKGEEIIPDPPVKGALPWLWRATEFFDVQVYSSRSKSDKARAAMREWMGRWAEREFPFDHPMNASGPQRYPIAFAHEKPAAFLTIDDRAICFDGMWDGKDLADLLNFKPWNKREIGATGAFPQGRLTDDDEGELKMAVGFDKLSGLVRVEFGKPVAWLALPPENAIALARAILKRAGAS